MILHFCINMKFEFPSLICTLTLFPFPPFIEKNAPQLTHRASTVTLAAHARRGLIRGQYKYKGSIHVQGVNTCTRGQYKYKGSIHVQGVNTCTRGQYKYKGSIHVQGFNTSIRGQYKYKGSIHVHGVNTSIRGQ